MVGSKGFVVVNVTKIDGELQCEWMEVECEFLNVLNDWTNAWHDEVIDDAEFALNVINWDSSSISNVNDDVFKFTFSYKSVSWDASWRDIVVGEIDKFVIFSFNKTIKVAVEVVGTLTFLWNDIIFSWEIDAIAVDGDDVWKEWKKAWVA